MVTVERWRPVESYEGYYEVSDQGRIRNVRGGKLLKLLPMKNGYLKVNLSKQGKVKTEYVHQLVAKTFLGPRPSPNHDACHGLGGPTDNRLSNLRWDTKRENRLDIARHAGRVSTEAECPLGHALKAPNLVPSHPTRKCLSCSRARAFAKKRGTSMTKDLADAYYEMLDHDTLST